MEPLTVTMLHSKKLLSVPYNHIQGMGETNIEGRGFVIVGGQTIKVVEDYQTILDMYWNLAGLQE